MKAAQGGSPTAIVKIARAYLKRLPSSLPYDPAAAAEWFRKGSRSAADGESHYGLAQMLLDNQTQPDHTEAGSRVATAVTELEKAALQHHPFAAFNLGVAHLHGHGDLDADANLAAEWFMASGLPEGYLAVAIKHEIAGRSKEAHEWREHARRLGAEEAWRHQSLQRTGTGGASGVSLHSSWPGNRAC